MVRRIILLALAAFLAGCIQNAQPNADIPSQKGNYESFSIQIPEKIVKVIHRSDQSDAFLTYDNTATTRSNGDYSLIVYPPKSLRPSSCSNALTGASQMTEVGENKFWGKVDFWDIRGWDYLPEEAPLCRPPSQGAAYALCSEHEGKTVLICVSQVKDDPTLAEEIFKTFRWTD